MAHPQFASGSRLLPGMFGAGGAIDKVVADVGLHFDQVVGVEVVAGASGNLGQVGYRGPSRHTACFVSLSKIWPVSRSCQLMVIY